MNTGIFKGYHDAELFYRAWNYRQGQKTIIILHRGHEHSERMSEFATDKRFTKYNVFSYDLRGHGKTSEKVSGVFMDYVRDLDCFVKFLHKQYCIDPENIFIVANSITSVVTAAWVHDFAPHIAGMALLAPAFSIKLYIPFAKEFVALGTQFNKNLIVQSYVKSKVLTHDKEQQIAYDSDPLITKSINGCFLVDCINAGKRIADDAAAINIPTLVFSSGKDYVVKNSVQKKFFVRLESEIKEFVELKDFYHGILFEQDRSIVYDKIESFAEKCFSLPFPKAGLQREKFTTNEYYTISLRMLPLSERINFAFQKWSLDKIGRLSEGMKLGLDYGFDSGISLDYVYKNKPQGKLGVGKLIDYGYLNAIGWRGIRIRKQHLLLQIEKQIEELKKENLPIRILDIAGGTGNYLFDIKEKYPEAEIVINDIKASNIEAGEKYIREKGYSNIRFTQYNCFDLNSYTKMNIHATITIISGIFELFQDNELASQAVQGIKTIALPNSVIIYTGQPWHPQLKMIACVLKSHQDKDWIMRRRSQKELDNVFEYNDVYKENMLMDDFGIFSVAIGRIK